MTRRRILHGILVFAACTGFIATTEGQTSSLAAGTARYRVMLALKPGDDLKSVAAQLAGTYRLRLEPDHSAESAGFMMTASETGARMVSRDPRVAGIDVVPDSSSTLSTPATASAPPRPAVIVSNSIPGLGTFTYDGSGNVTAAGDHTFYYDRFGRLKKATLGIGNSEEYTYDRYGNLKTITQNGTERTLGVNDTNNRLDRTQDPQTGAPYLMHATYDARGNVLTTSAGSSFVPDGVSMLKESTVDGTRKLYVYSASDERLATVTMQAGAVFRWDWTVREPSGKVLRRFSKSQSGVWAWEEDYIYREGQLLAAEIPTPDKTLHFHLDHLGTPRLITGNGGAQISQHTYWPFGQELTSPLQDAELLKFTGHERDAGSLDYMHARFYNAVMGRFLSVDPGGDVDVHVPQSWNKYSYVRNNPVNGTDPTGRCTKFIICLNYGQDHEMTVTASIPETQDPWSQAVTNTVIAQEALVYEASTSPYSPQREQGLEETFPSMAIAFPLALGVVQGGATGVAAEIQFAQKGVSATFRHGEFAGQTIDDVAAGLRSGAIHPDQLPVQTVVRSGVTYTMNNRSLMALQQAGMRPTIIRNMTGNGFLEKQLTQRLAELGGSPPPPGFVPFIRPPKP